MRNNESIIIGSDHGGFELKENSLEGIEILKTWLETDLEGGRHQRRTEDIENCSCSINPEG